MNRVAILGMLGCLAALIAIAITGSTGRDEPQPSAATATPGTVTPFEYSTNDRAERTLPDPDPQTGTAPTKRNGTVFAERGYERLLHSRRAAVMRVTWSWAEHKGQKVIRDVTLERSRTARDMGGHIDVFEVNTKSDLLRTESGDLIRMNVEVQLSDRVDTETVTRTATGYSVRTATGDNEEAFDIPTDGPCQLDAESFLVPRILSGHAKPGTTYTLHLLSTAQRKVIESTLKVIGRDDEGPGLKVTQTTLGYTSLWWFAEDGAVVRNRSGDSVIRRADHLKLSDLPRKPAVYPITLSANIDLPRLFTNRRMVVDVVVETDDTVRPPRFPKSPFTEVLHQKSDKNSGTVRLLLKQHDDPEATVPYPVQLNGNDAIQEFLKATPLMEVDDPRVKASAKHAVNGATDARVAAKNIADYVFRLLSGNMATSMAEPTALQILEDPGGDCSEHCLLFTTLCRAAGIPARRCSGYVCIGSDWGGHAWCEIWLGKWIGADPTTNEIGTRARYIFCHRQDDKTQVPASIRAARTKVFIRSAEYADGKIDFETGDVDGAIFSGITFAKDLPEGWRVERAGKRATLRTEKFRVDAQIYPDQGYRALDMLRMSSGRETRFGSRTAMTGTYGRVSYWIIPLGRQILRIRVDGKDPPVEEIAAAFKPTLDRPE